VIYTVAEMDSIQTSTIQARHIVGILAAILVPSVWTIHLRVARPVSRDTLCLSTLEHVVLSLLGFVTFKRPIHRIQPRFFEYF